MDEIKVSLIERISKYFEKVSIVSENLIFPNQRKGAFQSKVFTKGHFISRLAYFFNRPFTYFDSEFPFIIILWPLFLIMFILSISLSFTLIVIPINYASLNFIFLCIGFGIIMSYISYSWWVDTLANKNFTWLIKLILFLATVILINFLLKTYINQNLEIFTFPNMNSIWIQIPVIIFLLIPSCSSVVIIFFDLLLLIFFVLKITLNEIRIINQPRPIGLIKELITKNIEIDQETNESIRLVDLPNLEIQTILQWSTANRDNSEKRTIPTFIIATFFGVLLASDFIRNIFDQYLSIIVQQFTSYFEIKSASLIPYIKHIPSLGIACLLAIIILRFLKYLIALLHNIVTQNLIIEACIVAKYVNESQEIFLKVESVNNKRTLINIVQRLCKNLFH